MRTHRNSNTENLEQKTHQLNHDRPDLITYSFEEQGSISINTSVKGQ